MNNFLTIIILLFNVVLSLGTSVNMDPALLENKLNYTFVPIRESKLLTRDRVWPNYKGIGCITSDKPNNISYLITSTNKYSWDNQKCSNPSREVEIFKIDISKAPHNYVAKLNMYSDDCSDDYNSTFKINSNMQLCFLKYPNGESIQNKISSILIKAGHKLKLITECENDNIYRILDNTNSTTDRCYQVREGAHKYKGPEFSGTDWESIHNSNNSPIVIKNLCDQYKYIWNPTGVAYPGCNHICCMPNYAQVGYLRFSTEPNPMIVGRLLIGNPSVYDQYLEQQYTGTLGSDTVHSCGIDKINNVLYYVGANHFDCHSSYNTDASIVRIHLNNFTYRDRTKFIDMNLPVFSNTNNKYYNNPTSTVVDPGKYIYITFSHIYGAAILRFDIGSDKLSPDGYIRPTYLETMLYDNSGAGNGNTYTITLNYFTQSVIDIESRFVYFLHDPVHNGDTSYIIKVNLTKPFNNNATFVKKIEGITGVSKMEIDKFTGILYMFTGNKKPLRFFHFDENLERIQLANLCGQDFIELPTERNMRDFSIDYKTGYIYALSEYLPFAGVSRISSQNLGFDENKDSFPITVPFKTAKQHMFNHYNLLVGKTYKQGDHDRINSDKSLFFTERLNISSVFENLRKTIIATSADGPNLPFIFVLNNFGCIPGRGLEIDQCVSCKPGQYSDIISYENCIQCQKGKFTNVDASIICNDCDVGKFSENVGQNDCENCQPGYYNDLKGMDSCQTCNIGKFLPSIASKSEKDCQTCAEGEISAQGSFLCSRCSAGEYRDGLNSCLKCPEGRYGSDIGGNNLEYCQMCPSGKFLDELGATTSLSCKNCLVGKHGSIVGAKSNISCIECESGKFSKSVGSTNCEICPSGYISHRRQSVCKICKKGRYTQGSLAVNRIQCLSCQKGRYSETIASGSIDNCLPCTKGSWSNIQSLNSSEGCNSCSAGYYSDILAATEIYTCKLCGAGKYNEFQGSTKETDCINAPMGKFSIAGALNSSDCPRGKYTNTLGSSNCKPCEVGKYADEVGSILCKTCPENSEQNTDATGWICSEGSYLSNNDSNLECIVCPENARCERGSLLSTISVNGGYWRKNPESLNIIECRKKEYCIGGKYINSSNTCRRGHRGPLCDICMQGYAKIAGMCEVCPENNRSLNILLSAGFIIVVCIVLVFLIKTANDTDTIHDEFSGVIKVLTNYLQVFSLAKNFDINWPSLLVSMFDIADTASGPSIQFYSAQCAIGWDYYQRFLVYLAMPIGYLLVTILLLLVGSIVNTFLIKRKKRKRHIVNIHEFNRKYPMGIAFIGKWFKTSSVVGLFLMYPTVIKNLLQIVNCVYIDGKYYLSKDFDIVCYEGQHQIYAYVAYLFIIIYGVGIPYCAFHFLYQYRNRLYSSNIVASLKFIYIEYRPDRYYWELVIIFRKVAIIFMSVFLFSAKTGRYQMIIASWLVQFCLFLHILYQPYDTITEFGRLCNRLEIMSLASLVITLNSGIVFGTAKDNFEEGFFEIILAIGVAIINAIICAKFVYHIIVTGSNKTKSKLKKLCRKFMNGRNNFKNRCFKKICLKTHLNQLRRWSVNQSYIPRTLSIYEIPKATRYIEMLNTRSKGTVLLDKYLERLRKIDKRCYHNIAEKLLQFHSELELCQRNSLNNVIKYNNKIHDLQVMIDKNFEKDDHNLSVAMDLFLADAIEHRNTIFDLHNDGVSYNSIEMRDNVTQIIVKDCINGIIDKIEYESYIDISDVSSFNSYPMDIVI